MPVQAAPILEADVVAPILTSSPMDATPTPFKQCKVIEKGKKKNDAFRKRVIQSLMKDSILLHIVDKMIGKENAERFDESFTAFLKLGHYLFAYSKMVDLCQAKFFKALHEA
ncbi:hypothetical protein COCNU_scaffold002825G000020 [Cocos nucifera]|nr:hypothetical protein [Cocos nucifera]